MAARKATTRRDAPRGRSAEGAAARKRSPEGAAPAPEHGPRRPGAAGTEGFYTGLLRFLKGTKVPFMVGGTCGINAYTGQSRETKDLDIFCRPSDYPRLLKACAEAGFNTDVEDERWIAKVHKGKLYCDVIFGSANAVAPVTDEWFSEMHTAKVHGVMVRLLAPTEMIWGKAFIMDRYKFDGNDVAHLMLRTHKQINWKRLLHHFDQHWEVLLLHLLRFRYIYPSERDLAPGWLMDQLLVRLADQRKLPPSQKRACRGRLFSRDDFHVDIVEWGFADVVGDDGGGMKRTGK